MDKRTGAPFAKRARAGGAGSLTEDRAKHLLFLEPRTCDPFIWRTWTVQRTGFALSHARVATPEKN